MMDSSIKIKRELQFLQSKTIKDAEHMKSIIQKFHEKEVFSLKQAREDILVQLEQERTSHIQAELQHQDTQSK
jgi:hypothetical protein